jgi:NAD(P)-dependent dehydrogenase (short-subunit alcohol dehydrogenase family)
MDEMKTYFSGKVAVVTGGAHGIGKCIREEIERCGATVYVIDKADGDHFVGNLYSKEVMIYHGDHGWSLQI